MSERKPMTFGPRYPDVKSFMQATVDDPTLIDEVERAVELRKQIADAVERLEAAANEWREIGKQASYQTWNETIIAAWAKARTNLIACVDELARLRGEG